MIALWTVPALDAISGTNADSCERTIQRIVGPAEQARPPAGAVAALTEEGQRRVMASAQEDHGLGVCLLLEAADRGDPKAMYLLIPYYWTGAYGIAKDEAKAHQLLIAAAEHGHCMAQRDLADSLRSSDPAQSGEWHRRAVDGGCAGAPPQ